MLKCTPSKLAFAVLEYQLGYPDAFSKVWNLMQPSINRAISNIRIKSYDKDDLKQELAITLLTAMRTFTPTKGECDSYLNKCISNRLSALIQQHSTAKRTIDRQAILESELQVNPDDSDTPTLEHLGQTEAQPNSIDQEDLYSRLAKVLSPLELTVLHLTVQCDYTYQECCAQLNINAKQCDNALTRARNKIKKLVGEKKAHLIFTNPSYIYKMLNNA